jgi:hypothetical protein
MKRTKERVEARKQNCNNKTDLCCYWSLEDHFRTKHITDKEKFII